MKSIKKLSPLYIFILAIMLILPSLTFAGGWTGRTVISSVSINQKRILVYANFDLGNPDVCDKSSPHIVDPERSDYSEIYALLIASFLQGKQVRVYVNGCFNAFGLSHPNITVVSSYY